jgi:hypothetical protein
MIGHYHSIRPPLANFLNGARSKSVPSQEALYIRARLVVEEIVHDIQKWDYPNRTIHCRSPSVGLFEMKSYIGGSDF